MPGIKIFLKHILYYNILTFCLNYAKKIVDTFANKRSKRILYLQYIILMLT